MPLKSSRNKTRDSSPTRAPVLEPVLEYIPCAHVNSSTRLGCPNGGKLVCGRCQLVRYCSKECQTKHWRQHKLDCNDTIRREDWSPAWVTENRAQNCSQSERTQPDMQHLEEMLGMGQHLWGSSPAMDLLNLPKNENRSDQDMSLACMNSGDLRNIIRTVNNLPSDYSGELTVILSDLEPMVVLRNIIILLALGCTPDKAKAAELALHAWYSAFVPDEHELGMRMALKSFMDDILKSSLKGDEKENSTFSSSLGPTSKFFGIAHYSFLHVFLRIMTAESNNASARVEWQRIRFAPSRNDYHHFRYSRLEPSHRLAFQQYRATGVILPFGAPHDHFIKPNRYMFTPQGKWFENDLAIPLDSWNMLAVVQAGKTHGAHRADLYGCLYFYLLEQLRTFAERLNRFRINFGIFNAEPESLAQAIRGGEFSSHGLPANITFDRIDVSNLLDGERKKVYGTLSEWTPMLKKHKHATLIGHFNEWHKRRENAGAPTLNEETKSELVSTLIKDGRVPRPLNPASISEVTRVSGLMVGYSDACTAYYDNSKAFKDYLVVQGITKGILHLFGLMQKPIHTITPHRLCAPLGSPADTLPSFPNNESWYFNVCVGGSRWSERFVEFSRL